MKILNSLKENSGDIILLEEYINNNYQDLYDFFYNSNKDELFKYKDDIKSYIGFSYHNLRILNNTNKLNLDFIALLIDVCEKLDLLMEFKLLYQILEKSDYNIGNRLKSTSLYCMNINNYIDYDYYLIVDSLEVAYIDEGDSKELLSVTIIKFYLLLLDKFKFKFKDTKELMNNLYEYYKSRNIPFFDTRIIEEIFSIDIIENTEAINEIKIIFNNYLYEKDILIDFTKLVIIENSHYSNILLALGDVTFDKIRAVSVDYVRENIGNERDVHNGLNRGIKILDNEQELYQYIKSFSNKHKAKLNSSFEETIHYLDNKIINIIDWGCGQALATSLLIDFIKDNQLSIKLSDIILIEPSKIALSRGLLHLNVLKNNQDLNVKAINKDIDSLSEDDLIINNSNITLHLFSNILDVTLFKLNIQFLQKISNSQNNLNYFICVSPNINDSRNSRIDLFYEYFNRNFKTNLILERNDSINGNARYEKIFKVDFT
ncbi:MAG: hypothetical protein DRG78_13855 [Epsilonproteobacteria bacterium]|nr:MAG: hypothetical protein DRG78_13855 [Campylobacterota bacterium]